MRGVFMRRARSAKDFPIRGSAASTTSSWRHILAEAVLVFEFRRRDLSDPHNHEDLGVVILLLASLQLPLCTITTDPKQLRVHS
jgi:hypothetical protein